MRAPALALPTEVADHFHYAVDFGLYGQAAVLALKDVCRVGQPSCGDWDPLPTKLYGAVHLCEKRTYFFRNSVA